MKPVRVQWYVSADVECPHCGKDNDFMEVDEFWSYSNVGENLEKFHQPVEMTCEHCNKEFTVDGSDY